MINQRYQVGKITAIKLSDCLYTLWQDSIRIGYIEKQHKERTWQAIIFNKRDSSYLVTYEKHNTAKKIIQYIISDDETTQ